MQSLGSDDDADKLVGRILRSDEWRQAETWGVPRPGHPEGTVGRHVVEQLLPFIDRHFRHLEDYWNLVALAYLHDIGKPFANYQRGYLVGDSHSVISEKIAKELGAPDRLCRVIRKNDRPYSYWKRLFSRRRDSSLPQWSHERKHAFVEEFGDLMLDLPLLIRFHRADNAYRRPPSLVEQKDPVFWFENRLLAEGLVRELPPEGKDQRFEWSD